MEEWAKVVSQETEPMRVTAWGGHIWWLTYPAVTGSKNLTTAIIDIFPGRGIRIIFILEPKRSFLYWKVAVNISITVRTVL